MSLGQMRFPSFPGATSGARQAFVILLTLAIGLLCVVGCDDGDNRGSRAAARRAAAGGVDSMAGSSSGRGHDPEYGQALYAITCITCHGAHGQGMPKQGGNLRESPLLASKTDAEIVEFLAVGRPAEHPENKLGVLMPPRGGNQNLDDAALGDIVAYLRKLVKEPYNDDEAPSDEFENPAATQPIVGLAE